MATSQMRIISQLTCLPTLGQLLAKTLANMSTNSRPTDVD